MITPNKNAAVLNDFAAYCAQHPSERFWQALRNWSGGRFILAADELPYGADNRNPWRDTFYWEGKGPK